MINLQQVNAIYAVKDDMPVKAGKKHKDQKALREKVFYLLSCGLTYKRISEYTDISTSRVSAIVRRSHNANY